MHSLVENVQKIHARQRQTVVVITGGGSGALAELLAVPGGSNVLLEGLVPYSSAALEDFLRSTPERFCCEQTARRMAMAARQRAVFLLQKQNASLGEQTSAVGLGLTASLASDRPKKGDHRIHLAIQSQNVTLTASLILTKNARTRAEEERLTTRFALIVWEAFLRRFPTQHSASPLAGSWPLKSEPTDNFIEWNEPEAPAIEIVRGDESLAELLFDRQPSFVLLLRSESWLRLRADSSKRPRVLFPGSFRPFHRGHNAMIRLAEERFGEPVALEIALHNADKPPIDFIDLFHRLETIRQNWPNGEICLTGFPFFSQKANFFQPAIFLLGADTLKRLADPSYYSCDAQAQAAINRMADLKTRFLVFARREREQILDLSSLSVMPVLSNLCESIPSALFLDDISSTALRGDGTKFSN